MNVLHFSAISLKSGATKLNHLAVKSTQLVIAGWTGRNANVLEHHISELKVLGVTPPSTAPLYYRASSTALTQDMFLEMLGEHNSGEAEPVLFHAQGEWWLSVGSDHIDRNLEKYSVAVSKQMCAKPIARSAWRWRDVVDHQDHIQLGSQIWEQDHWVNYQKGTLADIRPLLSLRDAFWPAGQACEGCFMYCGTFPAIPIAHGDTIRPAERTRLLLKDHVRSWVQSHEYAVTALPLII